MNIKYLTTKHVKAIPDVCDVEGCKEKSCYVIVITKKGDLMVKPNSYYMDADIKIRCMLHQDNNL